MIRYIRISFTFIRYGGMIQCQSGSMICRYLPQNAITKCLLKIKLSLTGTHFCARSSNGTFGIAPVAAF